MLIKDLLVEKNMSIYELSKISSVPYTTCNDIVNGKRQLKNCSAGTVYKIANTLNISMDELLEQEFMQRSSFENFKSAICHRVKELGDLEFVLDTLRCNDIRKYYRRKWYPECLYLLAMLDYISRENNISICEEYDDLRSCKLEKVIYPAGIIAVSVASKSAEPLERAKKEAIPEFMRFNIIESDVRNVV